MSSSSSSNVKTSTSIQDVDFKNNAIKLYKEFISIPTISKATITNKHSLDGGDCNVQIILSQTDLIQKKEKVYSVNRSVGTDGHVHQSPFPIELTSPMVSISPSGSKMLTIKEVAENEYSFDVVDQHHLDVSITAKEIHRKVLNDEWFGGVSWSPCENYFAYIADRKVDTTSFYDKEPKEKLVGDQFIYRNDWGETYATIVSPSIYVVDLVNETVIPVLWSLDTQLTGGQVIWAPTKDSLSLLFVGWKSDLRKYGIRACFNRQSSIYYVDFKDLLKQRTTLKEQEKPLTTAQVIPVNLLGDTVGCFRSPRFSVCGKKILILGIPGIVLPHNTCSLLYEIDYNQEKPITSKDQLRVLIGEKNYNDTKFHGFYNQALPADPWLTNNTIIFSTEFKSQNAVFTFNLDTKELVMIKGLINGSCDVLDVDLVNHRFIFSESTINRPSSLYLVTLIDKSHPPTMVNQGNLAFKQIFENKVSEKVTGLLSSIHWYIEDVEVTHEKEVSPHINKFQIIQCEPKQEKKTPLLLFPHGGPHVANNCAFAATVAFLVSLGYAVTLINYRGSTGFGRDYVDTLPARIGKVDVGDCLATLNHLLHKKPNQFDRNHVGVIGGSHGGFLAAHLIGLPEQILKVSIMRNPVIDLPSMATLSDIPDWTFFEVGIPLPSSGMYTTLPTVKELDIMRQFSPIVNLNNMKTPTLLMLGDSDMRVPPSQGVLLYNAMRQKGDVPVKCVMYPKTGHALASVDAKTDQWIHIACWLREYLYINQ